MVVVTWCPKAAACLQDFLGGWWDATLRGARTGSVLEGGSRFLVEENYPGDPDDPYPQTWVPLVYYGPQPYPFQTPQVLLSDALDCLCTPRWCTCTALGELACTVREGCAWASNSDVLAPAHAYL